MVTYKFHSLEDFLISSELTVDGQVDDGWGALFPVKGREISGTVLIADMSGFSRRTMEMTATETLLFANNFFAWVSAEALRHGHGIVDKYVGDEMIIVFSREFGSDDPFSEALQTARFMAEDDAWSFCPHMGIASGELTVGYVGTPIRYNCSAFGFPVSMATRCATLKPLEHEFASSVIVLPESEWRDRKLTEVFHHGHNQGQEANTPEKRLKWETLQSRRVDLKNIGEVEIREIVKRAMYYPTISPEQRTKNVLNQLQSRGRYWPKSTD